MKFLRPVLSLLLASAASLAAAGEIKPYSPTEFDKLTQAGKPVVVDVTATWCPTCKAQKPIIDSLMQQPAYRDVTLLTVDFDSNSAALKRFKVRMQSTLVAFKGEAEVGRSTGDTTAAGLENLIKKTVD
ncbi:MAG TPA: thioredoxin family protein [Aromatoleum sp.]|uniref:thioredoxin family protein n=1 Tax=Aromatoleum sp. TaxID=2307007 RepID=UPI002B48B18C|nr:thioredoxin family protein [Aromatoleum sp.]HJV25962.1 thioredoxin family protein [Aromatoleum sp.]